MKELNTVCPGSVRRCLILISGEEAEVEIFVFIKTEALGALFGDFYINHIARGSKLFFLGHITACRYSSLRA